LSFAKAIAPSGSSRLSRPIPNLSVNVAPAARRGATEKPISSAAVATAGSGERRVWATPGSRTARRSAATVAARARTGAATSAKSAPKRTE
jgi:hypothetical protein